ncbi:GNAT family N-acetyltransferase [Sphingomonas flavalba]|uniref:GNAT family N-acetyltransferase n=1 Tax=Sphingomonas flavalba TaxID=2559804 RepID=UPI0039E1BD44
MGLTPLPAGQVAAVVTTLEMRERPRPRPMPDSPLRLVRWPAPERERYRALFRRVGAPWLWFSRLVLADAALDTLLADADVHVCAAIDRRGIEVGMLELDFRQPAACEIVYFGLVPELAGRGLGRWLMAEAMARAWVPGVERLWVRTCSLDHPSALGFYRAQGFAPVARAVETFEDPRRAGYLPIDSAPHVPLL